MLGRLFAMATFAALAIPAQAAPPLPPGVFAGERDAKATPAGRYAVDPGHTAVIAKVSHLGYALSVFRFDEVQGTLDWVPDDPARSTLTATVKPASISTPVPGFAKELAGPDYLNAAAFPDATFTSTAFRPTDVTHGTVDGRLTLLGQSQPVTFAVTLEGAGRGFMGHARLGVQATTAIDPQAFGLNPLFSTPIRIEIDAEFEQR